MKGSEDVKINNLNHLYLISDKVDGYFEKTNGSKYLFLDSTDENKEKLKNYTELWGRIITSIKKVNDK